MATESIELRQKRIAADAEHAKRNQEAIAAETAALEKLREFSSLTPAEKAEQTRAESLALVEKHEKEQQKHVSPAEQNKAGRPLLETKPAGPTRETKTTKESTDALADVPLTDAARRKASELKLTAADFKRKKKSGNDGEFTVADVERIAGTK